jgi:hypothetical protein
MKTELGMGAPEMKGVSLNEAINLPSLNINGMQSGNVGKWRRIKFQPLQILDLRLVLGNDWKSNNKSY